MTDVETTEDLPPAGGETFQGLLDLEDAYRAARDRKDVDPDGHRDAMQAFADARSWWRRVAAYQTAVTIREWLSHEPPEVQAEWAAMEAEERARQDQIAALTAQIDALRGEG